jgi:hypothetical protein
MNMHFRAKVLFVIIVALCHDNNAYFVGLFDAVHPARLLSIVKI